MENLREAVQATSGVELTDFQESQFRVYFEELTRWNQRFSLTSIVKAKEVASKHFADSLEVLRATKKFLEPPFRIVDIGSGAGFPGIPLGLVEEKATIDLIEATGKKARFLKHIVNTLALTNVSVHYSRAETLGQDPLFREQFDLATARGVGHVFVALEYLFPFCRLGGIVVILTKPTGKNTIDEAKGVMEKLGGSFLEYQEVAGSDRVIRRGIIVGRKMVVTSPIYPRKPGAPSKKPLGRRKDLGSPSGFNSGHS